MRRQILGTVALLALTAALLLKLRDRADVRESARLDPKVVAPIEPAPARASTTTPVTLRLLKEDPKLIEARPAASPLVAPSAPTESNVMAELRDLAATDPPLTLELARAANQRFGRSPDAPERTWYIVRALLDLDRRAEARTEALQMLRDYPGSTWSEDIYRHLLVNPGTHPAERGYGTTYELDRGAAGSVSYQ